MHAAPCRFVESGDGDGIEVGADDPGGRRRLLDLGDDVDFVALFKGGAESRSGGGERDTAFEFGSRRHELGATTISAGLFATMRSRMVVIAGWLVCADLTYSARIRK